MIFTAFMSLGVLGLCTLLGHAIITEPVAVMVGIGLVIGIFGSAFGFALIVTKIQDRKPSEKPDSLFVTKYKSYKSKVCPSVEYSK